MKQLETILKDLLSYSEKDVFEFSKGLRHSEIRNITNKLKNITEILDTQYKKGVGKWEILVEDDKKVSIVEFSPDETYLTVKEVSDLLKFSTVTIYKMIKKKELKVFRSGNKIRLPKSQFIK
ncbi:MAG: helix-turn-helix domain-containing protein [Bacteroidetes bacterium]|nr:helix-turn-helix domain-containing protein [Bacteroidota bacterium]